MIWTPLKLRASFLQITPSRENERKYIPQTTKRCSQCMYLTRHVPKSHKRYLQIIQLSYKEFLQWKRELKNKEIRHVTNLLVLYTYEEGLNLYSTGKCKWKLKQGLITYLSEWQKWTWLTTPSARQDVGHLELIHCWKCTLVQSLGKTGSVSYSQIYIHSMTQQFHS